MGIARGVADVTEAVVDLARVIAHEPGGSLTGLTLSLPAGSTGALIGTVGDGISCLASVLAGDLRVKRGRVRVAGADPYRSASLRARIGSLPLDPQLPPLGTVSELLALMKRLRGPAAPEDQWLAPMGLKPWLQQPVAALSKRQRRTVALAMALAVAQPVLLVLVEPLSDLVEPRPSVLRGLLEERARQGAAVLVLTSSVHDARELTDDVATLEAGQVGRPIGGPDAERLTPGSQAQVLVWCDHPNELAAALSTDKRVSGVMWSGRSKRDPLVVSASEVDICGAAIADAVERTGTDIAAIRPVVPRLDEVQAASAGILLARRHIAAYHATLQGPRARRSRK